MIVQHSIQYTQLQTVTDALIEELSSITLSRRYGGWCCGHSINQLWYVEEVEKANNMMKAVWKDFTPQNQNKTITIIAIQVQLEHSHLKPKKNKFNKS